MLGEQMLQKKQIYPILHSEGGENALISRQDLFEHWHLCRRCFRGVAADVKKMGVVSPPGILSCPGPIYQRDHFSHCSALGLG